MEHRPPQTAKFKSLILIILLGVFVSIFISEVFAQDNMSETSCQFPASKTQLLERFQNDKYVSNLYIEGDDLVEIMQKNRGLEIKIKGSIICNGLNFNLLNKQAAGNVKLPEAWLEEGKEDWIKQELGKITQDISIVENKITIENTTIERKRKTKDTPSHSVYAEGTLFHEVSFKEVTFKGDAHFDYAVFIDLVFFSGSIFKKADFKYAVFYRRTGFDEVIAKRDINFEEATFHKKASFDAATFGGDLNFHSTEFKDRISFKRANFGGELEFGQTEVKGEAIFSKATFYNEASFFKSVFHEKVEFNDTIFHQETYFNEAQFGGQVDEGCTESQVSTKGRKLSVNRPKIMFKKIQFKKDVSFNRTFFKEGFRLQDITFKGKSSFKGGVFCKKVSFMETSFKDVVDISGVQFRGNVTFSET